MIAVTRTLSRAILSASLALLLSVFDSNFSPISSIPRRPTEGKDNRKNNRIDRPRVYCRRPILINYEEIL